MHEDRSAHVPPYTAWMPAQQATHRTPRRWAAVIAAVALVALPAPLLLLLLPGLFHLHPWRLLAAVLLTFPATMPVLRMAHRYFHQGAKQG